jgi:hypothetical protein
MLGVVCKELNLDSSRLGEAIKLGFWKLLVETFVQVHRKPTHTGRPGRRRSRRLKSEIVKVRTEHDSAEAKRAALLQTENADIDLLAKLGTRLNAMRARLEHLAARLPERQTISSLPLVSLGNRPGIFYRMIRERLIAEAIQ